MIAAIAVHCSTKYILLMLYFLHWSEQICTYIIIINNKITIEWMVRSLTTRYIGMYNIGFVDN